MKTFNAVPNAVGLALCALVATASASTQDTTCDARDAVDGWGIWCGVEEYLIELTEQDPPGAGGEGTPDPAVPGPLAESPVPDIVEADPFGGDPQAPASPDEPAPVEPVIELPEGDRVFYRAAWRDSLSGPPSVREVSADGIGTMSLNLPDAAPGVRTEGVSVAGEDFDSAGDPIRAFDFQDRDFYDQDGNYGYIRVVLNDNEGFQSQFSAGHRVGQGGRPPYDLTIGLIDGKEQEILDDGEIWTETSDPPAGSRVLKRYWVGSRNATFIEVGDDGAYTSVKTVNSFVGGELTPLADIQALAGSPVATYHGSSQHLGQAVALEVDFGAQTFNGSWTGGQLPGGGAGNLDFNASGRIAGQHFVAESFSADVVQGRLQGSFFQPEAQAVGGAYEVEKTAVGRFNDTFSASKVISSPEL